MGGDIKEGGGRGNRGVEGEKEKMKDGRRTKEEKLLSELVLFFCMLIDWLVFMTPIVGMVFRLTTPYVTRIGKAI